MKKKNVIIRITSFYLDGFRQMTWGRTLWMIIIAKLIFTFLILRLLFFPSFLSKKRTDGDPAQFVGDQLINRMNNSQNSLQPELNE